MKEIDVSNDTAISTSDCCPAGRERNELLTELSAVEFALTDVSLYLDTHPCDKAFLSLYNELMEQAKHLRETYEAYYGPLTSHCYSPNDHWDWVDNPWPWCREFYR